MAADDREPPFEGGSQPVKQVTDPVPPSRPSPQLGILIVVIVVVLLAGGIFLFAH